jgi:hypothetical protein
VTSILQVPRLLDGAAQEGGAKPGALEQHGNGRAERPGPDDRGTTRMLAGIADAARRLRLWSLYYAGATSDARQR